MPCRCFWNLRYSSYLLLLLMMGLSRAGIAQDSTQVYPVHGVVLNSITHQPIARALVEEQSDAALTDSNGRFELQLPSQMVTITARRPGYDTQNQGTTRTIQVSANTPEITFHLIPQALITGRLLLPDEADASGIQVMAYRARMRHGFRSWEFVGSSVARSDGSFRLSSLQVGVLMLRTSPLAENGGQNRAIPDDTAKVFGYPSVSYPAVSQPSNEGGLKLTHGQQLNVNLVLSRQQFHTVAIAVRGVPEGVQPDVQLFGEDSTALQFPVQWNAQSRQASAKLPDGQYSVVAELNGQTPLFGRADFQVAGAPVSSANVTVLPLLPISINVHRNFAESDPETITAIPGKGVQSIQTNPGISMNVESVDGQARGGNLQLPPGSLDRSSLQLTGTQPGRYWVQAYPQEGYVSAITSGGVDLAREPLVVGPGSASQPIEITVRNDSGQIGCTVRSSATQAAAAGGQPQMAFVYAIPLTQTTQMPLQRGAPLNMEASLSPVPPGTYRVIALDQSINIDDVDKDDMDRYISKGQSVTVEAGGKATVSLSISHVNENEFEGDDPEAEY